MASAQKPSLFLSFCEKTGKYLINKTIKRNLSGRLIKLYPPFNMLLVTLQPLNNQF